jgi:hypothetical protein
MMLSVEDQIERLADVAFAQTSPVAWPQPSSVDGAEWGSAGQRRFVLAAAVALGVVLIGGLVAVLGDDSTTPATPPQPVIVSDPSQPAATTVAPTVETTTSSTSDPVQPSVVAVPSTPAPLVVTDPPPLVAIEADGDAILLDLGTLEPVLLYDGQDPDEASQLGDGPNLVDRVSVAADGSVAYVGLCCAPVVGTILETQPPAVASITDTPTYGSAPTLNPSATLLATISADTITVTDTAADVVAELPPVPDDRWGTPVDLMWLDDNTIAVLGEFTNVWTLTIVTTDGTTLTAGPTRPFALIDEFPQLRFAGTAITGEITVHDVGTDRVLSGTVDQYGNINNTGRGSSLQVITLPSPALSAWYTNPDELVWVDTDQQLRFGDQIIPGEYTWALR